MRKTILVLLCIVLLSLCGCTENAGSGPDGESSLFPVDYQPEGWIGYKQYGSAADEGYDPSVILTTDGKFIFTFYSSEGGTEELRGTYREEPGEYVLSPTEGDSQEFYSEHSEEIRLKLGVFGLTYYGEPNGVTSEGNVFAEDANFNFY